MMENDIKMETPLVPKVSFSKILDHYENLTQSKDEFIAKNAERILKAQAPYPELRDGFTDMSLLDKHKDLISLLLSDIFPSSLANNEIKAASFPYENIHFNMTSRFQKILADAGEDYVLKMDHTTGKLNYIMAATVILNLHYGYNVDFKRPIFYDIPDAKGILRKYRALYNADFMELVPTEKAKNLKQSDIDELLQNFDDLELWKEKIPLNSFLCKGL